MFSPTPWRYESLGMCAKTGEDFGNIIGADGVYVAEAIYAKDAHPIIAIVNASPAALGSRSQESK